MARGGGTDVFSCLVQRCEYSPNILQEDSAGLRAGVVRGRVAITTKAPARASWLVHQYLIELQYIQIGIADEADVTATVAHHDRPLADLDIFARQPLH